MIEELFSRQGIDVGTPRRPWAFYMKNMYRRFRPFVACRHFALIYPFYAEIDIKESNLVGT
jgi:hypothetical protein